MSYKNRILTKLNKLRYYNLSRRCIDDHVICDTVYTRGHIRDMNPGIYQSREFIGHVPAFYLKRADLYYLIIFRIKTCGLEIEDYVFICIFE